MGVRYCTLCGADTFPAETCAENGAQCRALPYVAVEPPRKPSSEFRAEGGFAKLCQRAYDDAQKKALKTFTERHSMYRWDTAPVTAQHLKVLANLAGEYAREAVAFAAGELRQQYINERATVADHEEPTREVPRTITKEFEKP